MILIDKHAAHERVNFERLKKGFDSSAQLLMQPEEVYLTPEEFNGMSEYADKLAQVGIIMEFTDGKARVTGLPQMLDKVPPAEIVECIAKIVSQGNTNAEGELFDDMLHTVACKASIRGNEDNDILELQGACSGGIQQPGYPLLPARQTGHDADITQADREIFRQSYIINREAV